MAAAAKGSKFGRKKKKPTQTRYVSTRRSETNKRKRLKRLVAANDRLRARYARKNPKAKNVEARFVDHTLVSALRRLL